MTDSQPRQTIGSLQKTDACSRSRPHNFLNRDSLAQRCREKLVASRKFVRVHDSERKCLTRCENCGKEEWVLTDNVLGKNSIHCRCTPKQLKSEEEKFYGGLYGTIRRRCTRPSNPEYKNYGGRGIKLNFTSKQHFITYCVQMFGPVSNVKGLEIDRRDNDGHYEPGNIRFVTSKENLRNTRRSAPCVWQGRPFRTKIEAKEFLQRIIPELETWSEKLLRRVVEENWTVQQIVDYRPNVNGLGSSGTFKGRLVSRTPDQISVLQYQVF